jgi:NitT/TauT family transport system ATP-binding protein
MSTELKSYPETSPTKALKIAELRNVSKTFHVGKGRELKVLDQIDLAVHEGELFALLG